MGYTCSNCGVDFSTRREIVEHMHDKHNCTFLEGDFAPLAEKLLDKEKAEPKKAALLDKIKHNRGD